MPSTFSQNRLYNLQGTGDNNGTWGVIANSDFSVIDLNFGGRLSIDASGSSDITVTSTQARNVYHDISGTLTGNIQYILPAEGMSYLLHNGTSGAHTLTAICSGGTGVVIPQGQTVQVFVNPDTPVLIALSTNTNQSANAFYAGPTTGSAAPPSFRAIVTGDLPTIPVAGGGTGDTSLTAYAVLCGGTTSTGALQSIASVGTSGQVLTSNGASALPTFQTIATAVGSVLFPVGSYYLNETDSTNPATLLGFGTWSAVTDRFIVGHGSTYTSTGGAATVTLTTNELPAHTHGQTTTTANSGGLLGNIGQVGRATAAADQVCTTASAGSGSAFSIIPPYQAVYIWKRTA